MSDNKGKKTIMLFKRKLNNMFTNQDKDDTSTILNDNINTILSHNKYFYILVIGSKSSLLSMGKHKEESKNNAIKTLVKKIKNINTVNNKIIYRITIKKSPNDKKNNLKMTGGPLVAIIENIKIIIDKEKSLKLKNTGSSGNNKVYFTKKFLSNNNSIGEKNIKKIAVAFDKNTTNKLFAINTIENI